MKLARLSRTDFDRLAAKTRLTPQSKEMAAAVLVDGRIQAEVAAAYGATRQFVYKLLQIINRVYAADAHRTSSVVRVTLDVPESLAFELELFLGLMQNDEDSDRRVLALEKVTRGTQQGIRVLKTPRDGK